MVRPRLDSLLSLARLLIQALDEGCGRCVTAREIEAAIGRGQAMELLQERLPSQLAGHLRLLDEATDWSAALEVAARLQPWPAAASESGLACLLRYLVALVEHGHWKRPPQWGGGTR